MPTPRRRVVPNSGSLLFVAAVSLTHCPSHPPPPRYLVVWPDTIRVQAPGRVPLKAELINAAGITIDAVITWTTDPVYPGFLESTQGRENIANVPATAPPEVTVIASANGKFGKATLLFNQVVSGTADIALQPVLPPPAPPPPPDPVDALYLTIASGRSTPCEVDRAGGAAFGRTEVGNFVSDGTCLAEGFILAAPVAPTIVAPMTWTNPQDQIPLAGGFNQTKEVRVYFWVEAPSDLARTPEVMAEATSKMETQLDLANTLLWKNRTGVHLAWDGLSTWSASPQGRCTNAAFITWEIPALLKVGVLNVFLVNKPGEGSGAYCVSITPNGAPPPDKIASHQEAILFNMAYHLPTTLAHEVGHALGLIFPNWGHPFTVPGILSTNLMKRSEELDPPERNHLSVGQVLQMHLSRESFLNRAAGFGVLCPQNGSRGACPALGLDLYSWSPWTP